MMKRIKLQFPGLVTVLLCSLTINQSALADDTEVLIGPGGQSWATPNVLFIMDTSGSMGTVDNPDTDSRTRLQIVQDVFEGLMNSNSGINVGLMRFKNGNGGYFISPMQELNTSSRADIIAASSRLTAHGNTPLAETLYEATRYYRGMSVDFGSLSVSGVRDPDNTSRYLSPITSQCQANYIILLTDGLPNGDGDADASPRIPDLPGYSSGSCSYSSGNDCLDEVADYLHTVDASSISGTQTVNTYTIGFTTNQTLLQDTASKGGGDYIVANNAAELSSAFSSILETIVGSNDTFSPPAIAANAFNSISHYNKLYFTLFEPAAKAKWDGNIKPYTLLGDPPQVTDANDNVAVDSRGYFLDTSRSFWSDSADGGSISEGGANSRLPAAADRKLYTFTGTYSTAGVPESGAASHPTLSNPHNALKNVPSSDLTFDMLGLPDDTEFDSIINTIRASTLGDPLHSKPALINYGGTESSPDLTLFVATNAGFLHAINATTGVEQFAFIPKELLTNLPALSRSSGSHLYGLDGDVTTWINDINGDGDVSDDGEFAYVYVGMRRGGNNYYALDVTNRNAPVLKWVIRGGPDGMTDFTELGQTWSRPQITTIKYAGSTRKVLIFGGGYDTAQDDNPINQPDSIGRAIYIVDADTGERLWWASPSASGTNLGMASMTNSIPSDIRLYDSNLDGNTDRLYVGDMGGHIFRIDLQATDTGVTGSGILLASLGATSNTDAANNRRFYYPPDVALTRRPGVTPYIAVNIGSGYRAHPLNPTSGTRVNDRFYSLHDPNVLGTAPGDFATIEDCADCTDLFDATTDLVTTETSINNLADSKGWFITLGHGNGEKVLAPSITINGEIFFTTYTPPVSVERTDCAPPPGIGTAYRVSLFDARPSPSAVGVDADGSPLDPTVEDRSVVLDRPGIPPAPSVMFRDQRDGDGNITGVDLIVCNGSECETLPHAIKIDETYWRDDN